MLVKRAECSLPATCGAGTIFLFAGIALCPYATSQSREQLHSAQGLDYAHEFRGTWKTIVSGKQDEIVSSELSKIITNLEVRAAGKGERFVDASRKWARNFRQWIASSKDGVVQSASSYQQREDFTFGAGSFWKKNVHRNGYDANLQGSGVEQLLRKEGVFVIRNTLVGFDEVFEISKDDPALLTLPTYALLAGNCIQLRAFLKREGVKEKGRSRVWLYQGDVPAIQGVFYPAWYDVVDTLVVLKESEVTENPESQQYSISIRDFSGGVIQEMRVVERRGRPWVIKKSIYLPTSTILYNESQARVVDWDPEHKDVPSFSDIASTPIEAKNVIDTRYRNFLIPVEIAKQGEAAIRKYIGLSRSEAEDASGNGHVESGSSSSDATANADVGAGEGTGRPGPDVAIDEGTDGWFLAIVVVVALVCMTFLIRGRLGKGEVRS